MTSIATGTRARAARSMVGSASRLMVTLLGVALVGAMTAVMLVMIAYGAAPLLGYKAWVIDGGSMEPTIANGSLVISRHVSPEDLVIGDIITYRPPDARASVTHRVVDSRELDGHTLFTTRGDANDHTDPVELELRDGANRAVWTIPLAGELVVASRGASGMLLFLAAPLLGLLALWLINDSEEEGEGAS